MSWISIGKTMPVIPIVCPVCLSTIVPDDKLSNPGCGHVFHTGCIEEWFRVQSNRKCPHCRISSRATQSQSIYLQFDENALNETKENIFSHSDEVQLVPKTNSELEAELVSLQRNLTKIKSEYSSYQSKVQSEKTQQEQTVSFLSNQLSNAESSLADKNEQFSTLTRKFGKTKESLEQARHDLTRKDFKVQDLERQLKSMQRKHDAEIERPCEVRNLLKSKSSEIRERVENYKHMGDHGIQVLAELTVALDGEKRQLKSELQSLKVEVEILRKYQDKMYSNVSHMSDILTTEKQKSSKSSLKRQDSVSSCLSLDETVNYSFEKSTNPKRLSDQSVSELNSGDDKENDLSSNFKQPLQVASTSSSSSVPTSTSTAGSKDNSSSENGGKMKRKAYLPVNSDDDDILMEQTIFMESPEFKNPFSNVKGSLLARKSANSTAVKSKIKTSVSASMPSVLSSDSKLSLKLPKRHYNGLGFSSAPLFKKTPSFPKHN